MVISRVRIRVTPFRALTTLLITYLLSPLPLQVTLSPQTPTCDLLNASIVEARKLEDHSPHALKVNYTGS